MLPLRFLALIGFVVVIVAQDYDDYESSPPLRRAPARIQSGYSGSPAAPKPTPVAILKQINRHNEDGSYTYGYEGGDGSFKIETKLPTGEVKGKYGYVDDTGKVRVVEYGATKYGFEPSGEGITVAPPTLVDETTNRDGSVKPEYTAEFYEPEPAPAPRPRPRPSYESYSAPQQFAPAPQRAAVPQRASVAEGVQTSTFEFGPESRSSARSFASAPAPSRPAPARSAASPSFSFAQPAPIEEDNYEPAPRPAPKITYAQPAPARQNSFSFDNEPKFSRPAPARPSSFSFDNEPKFSRPAPSRPSSFSFEEPRFAPQNRPAPQFAPAPRPAPRPAPSVRSSGGVLDQLAKDYALPQDGAAPLHDISFGYY